jgi:hypothetical protein
MYATVRIVAKYHTDLPHDKLDFTTSITSPKIDMTVIKMAAALEQLIHQLNLLGLNMTITRIDEGSMMEDGSEEGIKRLLQQQAAFGRSILQRGLIACTN